MFAVLQLYTFDVTGRAGYLFSDRALVTPSNTTSMALVKVRPDLKNTLTICLEASHPTAAGNLMS